MGNKENGYTGTTTQFAEYGVFEEGFTNMGIDCTMK